MRVIQKGEDGRADFFTCNCYTVSGVSVCYTVLLSFSMSPERLAFIFAQHLYILGGFFFGKEASGENGEQGSLWTCRRMGGYSDSLGWYDEWVHLCTIGSVSDR